MQFQRFLAILLLFVSFGSVYAQPWQARHGMTSSQFQSVFNELTAEGYRLVQVNAHAVGNESRYAAIWEKSGSGDWIARHGMTSAEYQSAFNRHAREGYRLVLVDGHTVGRQHRYAAIWEKASGPDWVARHGMTGDQYQQAFSDYGEQGYRLVHVSGYGHRQARFAAIWEKRSGPAWISHHGMTGASYQEKFDEYAERGFRPVLVNGYRLGRSVRYVAIWEQTGGNGWLARHGMTSSSYQHEFMDRLLQGYRLRFVSGYTSTNAARYAAIWDAEDSAVTGNYCNNGVCFDLNRLATEIESNLDKDVVKYGFEIRRGLSVIQRAEGPKRTESDPPAQEFTVSDRFNPASVSKAVTAVAMLKLLANHGISIDASIYPYLPTNWSIPPNNQAITFREVLTFASGLRNENLGGGYTYSHLKTLLEHEIDPAEKPSTYGQAANANFALLRILVAAVDGYDDWTNDPAQNTAARFIEYVNNQIFSPLGIVEVEYKPAAVAPTLFYPDPPGDANGTAYGDWTLRAGSAGGHNSVHELAMFADATFKGFMLPATMLDELKSNGFGFGDYGTLPDGSQCWGKGGYFPGSWNNGSELSSVLVHCNNGLTGMLLVNGTTGAKGTFLNAMNSAFLPE